MEEIKSNIQLQLKANEEVSYGVFNTIRLDKVGLFSNIPTNM